MSLEVSNSSIYLLDSGYNVLGNVIYEDVPDELKAVATALDESNNSAVGVALEAVTGQLADFNFEPWVVIEANWWRLNPARGDFHPKKDAPLLGGRGDASELPAVDLTGAPREDADIGAFNALSQPLAQ
jgi:hypothetical protein